MLKPKEKEDEESLEKSKADILMDMISHNLKKDFHFSNARGLNDSSFVDDKEKEEFNKVMNGFIKSFKDVILVENINKNIDTTVDFFTKYNGSKYIYETREKYKTENIDILDFWNETGKWKDLKFSSEYEKYAWIFLKYDPQTYAINIKQLEKYYGGINKKNKDTKAKEMIATLTKVFNEVVEAANLTSDLDKTINLSYNVKVRTVD